MKYMKLNAENTSEEPMVSDSLDSSTIYRTEQHLSAIKGTGDGVDISPTDVSGKITDFINQYPGRIGSGIPDHIKEDNPSDSVTLKYDEESGKLQLMHVGSDGRRSPARLGDKFNKILKKVLPPNPFKNIDPEHLVGPGGLIDNIEKFSGNSFIGDSIFQDAGLSKLFRVNLFEYRKAFGVRRETLFTDLPVPEQILDMSEFLTYEGADILDIGSVVSESTANKVGGEFAARLLYSDAFEKDLFFTGDIKKMRKRYKDKKISKENIDSILDRISENSSINGAEVLGDMKSRIQKISSMGGSKLSPRQLATLSSTGVDFLKAQSKSITDDNSSEYLNIISGKRQKKLIRLSLSSKEVSSHIMKQISTALHFQDGDIKGIEDELKDPTSLVYRIANTKINADGVTLTALEFIKMHDKQYMTLIQAYSKSTLSKRLQTYRNGTLGDIPGVEEHKVMWGES